MTRPRGRESVRVGLIGTGFAATSHLDALSRVAGVEVAGLVGSTEDRARAAARRLELDVTVYPDLDALLGDPHVQAVHVCTPNHLHAPMALQALAADKYVLSEKPLALDPQESARLVVAASDGNTIAGVCFNYRHFPLVQQIRSILSSGAEGAVHLVHGSYLQDWLLFEDDWNWRLQSERAGSPRAIGDIGSHWIDTVEHVTGQRVTEVMADLGRLHEERVRPPREVETFAGRQAEGTRYPVETDDFGSVLLRFTSGLSGSCVVSQVSPGRKNRLWFEIDAARRALAWDQEEPNRLWIGRRDGPDEELVRDPALLDPAPARLARYPGGHQEGWPDALRNLFEDFYAAVAASRRGEAYVPTFASFEDGHHLMQVVDAIQTSHRTGAWVAVGAAARHSAPMTTREVES